MMMDSSLEHIVAVEYDGGLFLIEHIVALEYDGGLFLRAHCRS